MRIGIDIDGVLANFYEAYENLCIQVDGKDRFGVHKWPNEYPCTWNWPEHYGYSAETVKTVWELIKKDPYFWANLRELPDFSADLLDSLEEIHEVYYITARPGLRTKRQTERWLESRISYYPTVLISDQKGLAADCLKLDVYVDDKWENIEDVLWDSPETLAFLVDRPYNQNFMDPRMRNFKRVKSLAEVFNGA